jgi:hypothetical protein
LLVDNKEGKSSGCSCRGSLLKQLCRAANFGDAEEQKGVAVGLRATLTMESESDTDFDAS